MLLSLRSPVCRSCAHLAITSPKMLHPCALLSCQANLCVVVQSMSPGQLLTPNTVGMSPHAQLLHYAATRDAPSTPLPHNGEYRPSLQFIMLCCSAASWLCTAHPGVVLKRALSWSGHEQCCLVVILSLYYNSACRTCKGLKCKRAVFHGLRS